jgi:hypothetical protein
MITNKTFIIASAVISILLAMGSNGFSKCELTFAALAAMAVTMAFTVVPALTSAACAVTSGLKEGFENNGGNEPTG